MEGIGALQDIIVYYGHTNWIKTIEVRRLIHASELDLLCTRLYREAIRLQRFCPRATRVGVVALLRDDLYPITSKLQYGVPVRICMALVTL